MKNHTFQLSRNNKEKISLDSYLLNSTIPKKKNKQYNNLKSYSSTLNNNPQKQIKRSFSATNNLINNYQNISNSFLRPNYISKEKKKLKNNFSEKNINDFLNNLKSIRDLDLVKKNNSEKNILNNISPIFTSRVRNSLEKSIKNINFIKNNITWEYKSKPMRKVFSREYELNKINKILDSNNNLNLNENNCLKSSYQIYKNSNLLRNSKFYSNLTTSSMNKSKNNVKGKDKKKINKNLFRKFEYNKNYLKPFKKEKIVKRFPLNEIDEFSNGLMVSPYL